MARLAIYDHLSIYISIKSTLESADCSNIEGVGIRGFVSNNLRYQSYGMDCEEAMRWDVLEKGLQYCMPYFRIIF